MITCEPDFQILPSGCQLADPFSLGFLPSQKGSLPFNPQTFQSTMTTANQIDWFVTAGSFRAAFELRTREPDNSGNASEFYAITAEARQTVDDLVSFIHELHDDEMPNDWRYAAIVGILDQIIEISEYNNEPEWSEASWQIAESLTSIYTSELAAWFADNSSRASYRDEAQQEGLISESASLTDRMQASQHYCIRGMADRILSRLELV